MNTPTPITDAHKGLWTKLFNLAHDEIFDDFAQSDGPAHQLIADSEAEAVLKQTAYLKAMVQDGTNAMKERDQLRAEVKRMTHAYEYDHKCLYEVRDRCHLWKQRAEKAEADLAKARATAELRDSLAIGQDNCDDAYDELATDCAELRADVVRLTARAERAEAELAKYLSACPASPTEEERKRCQQWWAISGKSQ